MQARSDYHHGNLRRALLDAALALFAERGRFDFTMRELARAAGVTHNAPYRHFADRWALYDALAAEGFVALAERFERAELEAAEPRERIARLGEAYVRFAAENRDRFRLMFLRPLGGASPELARAAQKSFGRLREAIAGAARAGVLRAPLAEGDAAIAAWSLVHGLASLVVGGQLSASPRAMRGRIEALTRVFADGALAPESRLGATRGGLTASDRTGGARGRSSSRG